MPKKHAFEIIAQRGQWSYIVVSQGRYYMITPELGSCNVARPPEIPDCFLKFGYWEEVAKNDINDKLKLDIESIFNSYKNKLPLKELNNRNL